MVNNLHKRITSFHDLEVYQNSYKISVDIMKELIPKLPEIEKYDLKDQISRACKAVPRLIAEGYAKRHQKKGFQKYIDDAMAECNEMIVNLSHCKDIYYDNIDPNFCTELIKIYDITGRQLYNLSEAWSKFHKKID